MATVYSVTTTRVRDGKYQEALSRYRNLKGAVERNGGAFHVRTQLYGTSPLTLTTIMEAESWPKFGALLDALEKDNTYQDFLAQVRSDPFGDIVQRNLLTDVTL